MENNKSYEIDKNILSLDNNVFENIKDFNDAVSKLPPIVSNDLPKVKLLVIDRK